MKKISWITHPQYDIILPENHKFTATKFSDLFNELKSKEFYSNANILQPEKAEVEDLYNSLSRFAAANGLVISKIEKKEPKPVFKKGKAKQSKDKIKVGMISYYKIPVDYEIKGNFLGYIKFKRAVSKSKKSLNFDKETISVVQNDSTGAIIAKGELTIVGLPNEFF